MHKTEYIPAATIEEAAEKAPWAFKIIRFEDGFIAFETPFDAHLWAQTRKQF